MLFLKNHPNALAMPILDRPVTPPNRRGGRSYFVAAIVAQVSALLRYVILARLLGPEQLGLASTLVVTAAFFDLISDTGSDRFMIQDRHGDAPAAQQLVHLVMVVRGGLIALGLVLAAWPASLFFNAPRLCGAIMVLALSPLTLGLMHFDYRRMQRHLDYRAEALTVLVGESVSVLFTATAAYLTHDFTSVLYGLIARAVVMVLISHLRAERPYRLGFSRQHAPALFRFSGPLILNGMLLFLGSQGDRVVIANRLGVKELGYYSAVLLLIYYPSAMLLRYVHAMYLPLVAAARDDPSKQDEVVGRLAGQTLLLSVAMVAGFVVVAPKAIVLLFGYRYTQSMMVVALVGVLQTFRYMVVWPTTVALGRGNSRSVLAINAVRVVAYPSAVVGGWLLGGLAGVLAGFIMGEAVALVTGVVIVNSLIGAVPWRHFDRVGLFGLICASIVAATISQVPIGAIILAIGVAVPIGWTIRRERSLLSEAVGIIANIIGLHGSR
jgi:O-antigen/teichoic acid export membrane protein